MRAPVYAGAYAFGKSRRERYVDVHGRPRKRTRRAAPSTVGGVDLGSPRRVDRQGHVRAQSGAARWDRPPARAPATRQVAVREGQALLQGMAVVRALRAQLEALLSGQTRSQEPRVSLPRQRAGRGPRPVVRWRERGRRDRRAGRSRARCWPRSRRRRGQGRAARSRGARGQITDAALAKCFLRLERHPLCRGPAGRAPLYRQVELSERRGIARGLERDSWEKALGALSANAEAELSLRERQRPRTLTDQERAQLLALG